VVNYCYVAVRSAALGASAPIEGGEGRGHNVAAACPELEIIIIINQCKNKLVSLSFKSWCKGEYCKLVWLLLSHHVTSFS